MAKKNGAHTDAPDQSTQETATNLQQETLRGDIRDALLTEFKHMPKPWQQMTENEQERLINRTEAIAKDIIQRSINIVAERGLPALAINVGKFTVDGAEMKGTFEAYADDANLLRIRHLAGQRAIFVLASPDAYAGEQKPAETENVGDLAMPRQDEHLLDKVGQGAEPAAAH